MIAVGQHRGQCIGLKYELLAQISYPGLALANKRHLPFAKWRVGKFAVADQKAKVSRPGTADMPIHTLCFRNKLETPRSVAGRLGAAQKQDASFSQCEMRQRYDFRLRLGHKIYQQIAA